MQSRRKCSAENDVNHSELENVYRDCLRRKEKISLRNAVYQVGGKKYVLFTSAGKKLPQFQVIVSVFPFSSSSRSTFPAVAFNESALYRQSAFTSWFFCYKNFSLKFSTVPVSFTSLFHSLSFSLLCVMLLVSCFSSLPLSLSLPLSHSFSLSLILSISIFLSLSLSLSLFLSLSLSPSFFLSLALNFAFLGSDASSFSSLVLCSLK